MLKYSLAAVAAATLSLASLPAFAGTQDDVQTCRDALTADGRLDMANYRLSFESKKGNSTRTLTLEAVPYADGAKYVVKCTIDRAGATSLELQEDA